jgi:glutathione reductase (NADPH)
MAKDYDFVVLGSGNAGSAAAWVAKEAGKSVAMIESWDVGGTCALRGCVPKKVYVAAAETLHAIAQASEHHIAVGPATIDWPALLERKQGFVRDDPAAFEKGFLSYGYDVIHGAAKFTGANTLTVGDDAYGFKQCVVATGSKARSLPIPGFEHTITSDDIMEMAELPESVVFIGGGVIAFEFGHVFQRAGAQVTILEVMDRALPMKEPEIVDALLVESRRIGMEVITGAVTSKIVAENGGYTVHFAADGKEHTRSVAMVANGAGRVANLADLDLDAAGIDMAGPVLSVDKYLRSTSNPSVFGAGDTIAGPQLSALASYEGRIAGENAMAGDGALTEPEYASVPSVVFSVPNLASVGMTEAQATEAGLDFTVKTNEMTSWRSAVTYAETASMAKVLVDNGSDMILGANMLGHGAAETIHTFSFAIKYGITASQLATNVYAYPTMTNDIKFLV